MTKTTHLMRVGVLALSMAGLAFADNVVQYDIGTNQTSTATQNRISFGASGSNANNLVGTNIAIPTLARLSGSPWSGISCVNCLLSFVTGAINSYTSSGPGPFPTSSTYQFGGGGTATITGGVDFNSNGIFDPGDIAVGSSLLTGFFLGNASTITGSNPAIDYRVTAGVVLNSQNTQLNQRLFGGQIPGPVWTGVLNIGFKPFGTPPPGPSTGAFSSPTFTSSQIVNGSLLNSAPVPEPGSVLLFSSITGFLGIGLVLRRRRMNQA